MLSKTASLLSFVAVGTAAAASGGEPWKYPGQLPTPAVDANADGARSSARGWPTVDEDPFPPSQTDYQALSYDFSITLTDESNVIYVSNEGSVEWLTTEPRTFILDLEDVFNVRSVTVDSTPVSFTHENDLITASVPASTSGRSSFTVEYDGIPVDGLAIGETMYGARCFFGDNWPNRAHQWLAVNDHPSDKATVAFHVTAPDQYDVVATGNFRGIVRNGDGTKTTNWASTVEVATKVMVIGVAEFAVMQYTNGTDTRPMSFWVYPENAEEGFAAYAPALEITDFLEGVYGEFPYEKNDHVQSKTIFGGMENAGNVFYYEESVFTDASNLIAHELGHQWFGNSASECEWNHIWLSEGFATLSPNLWVEATQGRAALENKIAGERRGIIGFQARNPANSVVCRACYTDLLQLLNTLSYEKGGFVLHMLRNELGDDAFFRGVRAYYAKYRDNCALTPDLQKIMEDSASLPAGELDLFFTQWIMQPGHPVLDLTITDFSETGLLSFEVSQVQSEWDTLFDFPLTVAVFGPDDSTEVTVRMPAVRTMQFEAQLPANWDLPTRVELDPHVNLLWEPAEQTASVAETF